MTLSEFNASIRQSFSVLSECKILRTTASIHSLDATPEFREVTLDERSSYRDVYLCGIRNGDYNFLLRDYSFLQFTHTQSEHFRFAFYPNPFSSAGEAVVAEAEAAVNAGILSFEEYSEYISEQPYEVRMPVIRFELHCAAYVELEHPAAHFHFGMHTENRWPVARRLTPRLFSLLIAKHFYGTDWILNGAIADDGDGYLNRFDRQFASEKAVCGLLQPNLFSQKEREQLHFT